MTLEISCSPNDAIGTVFVTLKEKQPLHLNRLVYSALKGRQVTVIVDNQNYTILCVVKTLCEQPPTTTATTYITNDTRSKEDTDENNIIISPAGIAITVAIVMMLLLLIVLVIVTIMLRFCNRKQKSKRSAKSKHNLEHNLEANTHTTTPAQPAGSTEAVINERPSTSSNDTGFISLSDTESPVSDNTEDPFPSNINQPTENFNTNLSNGNTTDSTIAADGSNINPLGAKQSKHKVGTKNQINSTSKHQRSTQSPNELGNIHWKQNEVYCRLDPRKSVNPYKPPATVQNPLVTGEAKIHYYDDIEGINESRRRAALAAANGRMHHKKKHTKPRSPANHSIKWNLQPAHYDHNVSPVRNVTISVPEKKLLHVSNNKHGSLSQV